MKISLSMRRGDDALIGRRRNLLGDPSARPLRMGTDDDLLAAFKPRGRGERAMLMAEIDRHEESPLTVLAEEGEHVALHARWPVNDGTSMA